MTDVFYIGGTKCGTLLGEAVVISNPSLLPHFFTVMKQGGAVLGYALAYPVGVAVAIVIVAAVINRPWPGRRDPRPASADGITAKIGRAHV